ncbi:MAG: hypothetical protein AAFQ94_31715 [Bacteroidota bacterium]
MKKYLIIGLTLMLFLSLKNEVFAQLTSSQPEIAKWQSEQDAKSFWEFKNDGKLYSTYSGRNYIAEYRYQITSAPPICQEGVSLAIEKNVKFLQLTDQEDGSILCFYIYGLNAERLTVMDAQTGHIFPFIKAED